MPSFPSPKPTVNYFDDLDYFKVFEREFPAIVYNDGLTSKLDFLTEPTVSPQHIDEFNLKDETSLSECDEEEQNDLAVRKSTIWYTLKKTCVELIQKFWPRQHTFAQRTQIGESSRATYQGSSSF
ncbi:hypothetical protein Tco_0465485 [Tanacetum coccineum]